MKRSGQRSSVVNIGVYRHFAVATLLITGLLGMFASSVTSPVNAAQAEGAVQQKAPGPDSVDLAISGKGGNDIHNSGKHAWTYVDSFGGADNMVTNLGGGVGQLDHQFNSYIDSASGLAGSVSDSVAQQVNLGALTGSELKRRRADEILKDKATADQIAAMVSQSRIRSGSGAQ